AKKSFRSPEELALHLSELRLQLGQILHKDPNEEAIDWEKAVDAFFDNIPNMHTQLLQDVTAMYAGDPAAKSENEVIRTYPGFYAIAAYRTAHQLHKSGVKIIPRMITEHAHSKT